MRHAEIRRLEHGSVIHPFPDRDDLLEARTQRSNGIAPLIVCSVRSEISSKRPASRAMRGRISWAVIVPSRSKQNAVLDMPGALRQQDPLMRFLPVTQLAPEERRILTNRETPI